ncbi:MAG: TonB-dependent receptor [Bacteroidetes bacterium]|nr:TonB-dependent receptor [Bacteroidota bacterium]
MKKTLFFLIINMLLCRETTAQVQTDRDTVYQSAPVTVTATYATERMSPVTFSNLKRQEIQQRYSIQDVPALLSELPSIMFYSESGSGTGYNYINMRGFDQRRLSVMINGVPQNDPEDHNVYWIDFPDLLGSATNIQVQRGAGSAFYGPPAIGGSVNIIALPYNSRSGITLESSIGLQEYGSTNTIALSTRKYSVSFNSGLTEKKYMFYGRLGTMSTDGYRDKAWANIDSYFFGAARFDSNMTTHIHFYGGPFSDGLVYTGLPKFYNNDLNLRRKNYSSFSTSDEYNTVTDATLRKSQEIDNFSQPHLELLHEWRLSSNTKLNNTIFYIQGDGYYDYYDGWADTSTLRLGTAYGFPVLANPANVIIRAFVGNKQIGWLPRVEWTHGEGTLTMGAELRFHRSIHWGKINYAENLPQNYDPDYRFYEYNGEKDMVSFYVHELYQLRHDITLMTDVQFVYNRYGIANEKYLGYNFSFPYFFINPRAGINYNLNEQVNLYSSIAYTSREPRLKNLYAAGESFYGEMPQFEADITGSTVKYDFCKPLVKPERLFDFEIGGIYRDETSLLSVNLFWMEFTDELIKSGRVDIFGQPVTGNAERTRHIGVEMEGQAYLGDGFSIGGNASLSNNRLVKYSVADSSSNGVVYKHNLDGNPIAGSPDYMAGIRLTQKQDSWSISADAKYVGSFYTDNTKNELFKNDEYFVLNLSCLYTLELGKQSDLTIRAEARNLLNKLYTMSGEGDEFFPAAERNYVFGIILHY